MHFMMGLVHASFVSWQTVKEWCEGYGVLRVMVFYVPWCSICHGVLYAMVF